MREIILFILMGIVTVGAYIGYLPQIIKLIKTKQAEGISLSAWYIWIICMVSDLIYAIMLGRIEMIIMAASELGLSLIIIFLVLKYQKIIIQR